MMISHFNIYNIFIIYIYLFTIFIFSCVGIFKSIGSLKISKKWTRYFISNILIIWLLYCAYNNEYIVNVPDTWNGIKRCCCVMCRVYTHDVKNTYHPHMMLLICAVSTLNVQAHLSWYESLIRIILYIQCQYNVIFIC